MSSMCSQRSCRPSRPSAMSARRPIRSTRLASRKGAERALRRRIDMDGEGTTPGRRARHALRDRSPASSAHAASSYVTDTCNSSPSFAASPRSPSPSLPHHRPVDTFAPVPSPTCQRRHRGPVDAERQPRAQHRAPNGSVACAASTISLGPVSATRSSYARRGPSHGLQATDDLAPGPPSAARS